MQKLLTRGFFQFSNHQNQNQNLLKTLESLIPISSENSGKVLPLSSVLEYYETAMHLIPADPSTRKNQIASTGAFIAYSGAKTG